MIMMVWSFILKMIHWSLSLLCQHITGHTKPISMRNMEIRKCDISERTFCPESMVKEEQSHVLQRCNISGNFWNSGYRKICPSHPEIQRMCLYCWMKWSEVITQKVQEILSGSCGIPDSFFFLRSPAISLGFTTFGWDFCVCDHFLIQPLR